MSPPSPTPQSFCNVIDSILRKCIYFQIKYLFKEWLRLLEICTGFYSIPGFSYSSGSQLVG